MGSYYTFTIIKSTRLKMAAAPERGGGHSPFMAKNKAKRNYLQKNRRL